MWITINNYKSYQQRKITINKGKYTTYPLGLKHVINTMLITYFLVHNLLITHKNSDFYVDKCR